MQNFQAFQTVDKENLESRIVSIGGELEIANYQNTFFSGLMTDVNVWDQTLSTNELQDFGLSCSDQLYRLSPPTLINWQNVTTENHSGSITRFNVSREETCLRSDDRVLLFKHPIPFEKSFSLCGNLGGKLYLPETKTEFQKFLSQVTNPGEYLGL
jgi:hypothetical protein